MPFKSKQQSKACFATGGFGGKVDCGEWAHKTNYKKLPEKKNEEVIQEDSPKGWTGTVRAMLIHHPELNKSKDKNPWALAHYMKNKGDEAHYKDQKTSKKGTPHKKEKFKDEDEEKKDEHFITWQEWYILKEENACKCPCSGCKSGNCKKCSCEECKCKNCGCC